MSLRPRATLNEVALVMSQSVAGALCVVSVVCGVCMVIIKWCVVVCCIVLRCAAWCGVVCASGCILE